MLTLSFSFHTPSHTDTLVGGSGAIESESKAPAIVIPLAGVALVAVAALVVYRRAKRNNTKAGPVPVDGAIEQGQDLSVDADSTDSIDADSLTRDLA